jgi:hypothetical protein
MAMMQPFAALIKAQTVDYDPKRKQFAKTPELPPWALPGKQASGKLPEACNGESTKRHTLPADGPELERRLAEYDSKLADEGLNQYRAPNGHERLGNRLHAHGPGTSGDYPGCASGPGHPLFS